MVGQLRGLAALCSSFGYVRGSVVHMCDIIQVDHIDSNLYGQDEIRYNLMILAEQQEKPKLFSNQKDIVICQASKETPVWIWNKGQLTNNQRKDLMDCLIKNFTIKSYTTFMVKPELESFCEDLIHTTVGEHATVKTEMMAYAWRPCEYPTKLTGHIEKPNMSMVEAIAEFRARDINEMEHLGVCISDLKREAAWMIRTGNTYVWFNEQEVLCSLAFVAHRMAKQARINRVYTNPRLRNRGYGSMLMHELAVKMYKEGRIAMVYADAKYMPSNKTYKKSGFIEQGKLYEIGIKKDR